MKTRASVIIHYCLLCTHYFIKSWAEFISKVALPLSSSTNSLYLAKFIICRCMAPTVCVIHNTNTRRISPSLTSFMLYNLCVEKLHTCNFSFRFNGNWFSLMLKYPPCPCYFYSELNFLASSCSLSYYICVWGRERERGERKKEHLLRSACECVHSCVRLYESTRVSATVNKSHGQPEQGTMVSPQTATASTTP